MRRSAALLLAAAAAAIAFAHLPQAASDADIVVSVKPIHSLVAGVMDGVGKPRLVLKGGSSPHSYALKPSDAEALEHAKVVFWVGETMETVLAGPIKTLARKAKVVALSDAHGLTRFGFREGGPWDGHGKNGPVDLGKAGHGHDEIDMHLWLDPANAKVMVREIVKVLAKSDAKNAAAYEANGLRLEARLDVLMASIRERIAAVRDRPFVVFHDAYQYLEKRFGLNALGSITVSPEVKPGAKRVAEIKKKIGELGAVCVFAEPQFEPKLVRVVSEGTKAKTGTLDPIGADLAAGADLYFELMERNAKALTDCLGKTS